MTTDTIIRPLTSEDAAAIAVLELKCPEAPHWGEQGYQQVGQKGLMGWVALGAGAIEGFILVRVVADEMEILNLAVEPTARRKGIGSRLMSEAAKRGQEIGAKRTFLEVRESNVAARALYASFGFGGAGRRKGYYSQPVEDAIILVRELH